MSDLTVTVDWERQREQTILVTYQINGELDSIAWTVGRPQDDNLDDERRDIEEAIEAAREQIEARPRPLWRLIITEGKPSTVRALWGSAQRPVCLDANLSLEDLIAASVIEAAHRIAAARLDAHRDTAS